MNRLGEGNAGRIDRGFTGLGTWIRHCKVGSPDSLAMVTTAAIVSLTFIVVVHSLVATVLSRFFRLRLRTRFGAVLFTVLFVPIVLLLSLTVLSGVLGLGGDGFDDRNLVLTLTILLPFLLGYSIDRFWLPNPADVSLEIERERAREERKRR